jgi:ABC-type glucose/galactose transport system permease subunit
LLTRRRVAGIYAAVWLVLAFGGLVATYWISNHRLDNDLENSSWRTIVTLLVTGLCLTPLLLEGAVTHIRDAIASLQPLQVNRPRGPRSRRAAS